MVSLFCKDYLIRYGTQIACSYSVVSVLNFSGMTNLLMGTELTTQQLEYVKVAQASGNSLMYMFHSLRIILLASNFI